MTLPTSPALRATRLFRGENELWGLIASENKQRVISADPSSAAATRHQGHGLPGQHRPRHSRPSAGAGKKAFKGCSCLWGLTKESSHPPWPNNPCSFSARDIRDASPGKQTHELCSIYCLSFGLKRCFPPYLHIHLQQLFAHRADDVQVFSLRLGRCGVHRLHGMQSATAKKVHVIEAAHITLHGS